VKTEIGLKEHEETLCETRINALSYPTTDTCNISEARMEAGMDAGIEAGISSKLIIKEPVGVNLSRFAALLPKACLGAEKQTSLQEQGINGADPEKPPSIQGEHISCKV